MSQVPENVQIDIKALTDGFQFIFRRMREYFEQLSKVINQWFPVISSAHRQHMKAVHTEYHRRQKARRRRRRR